MASRRAVFSLGGDESDRSPPDGARGGHGDIRLAALWRQGADAGHPRARGWPRPSGVPIPDRGALTDADHVLHDRQHKRQRHPGADLSLARTAGRASRRPRDRPFRAAETARGELSPPASRGGSCPPGTKLWHLASAHAAQPPPPGVAGVGLRAARRCLAGSEPGQPVLPWPRRHATADPTDPGLPGHFERRVRAAGEDRAARPDAPVPSPT